jgi:hypothetical protein
VRVKQVTLGGLETPVQCLCTNSSHSPSLLLRVRSLQPLSTLLCNVKSLLCSHYADGLTEDSEGSCLLVSMTRP